MKRILNFTALIFVAVLPAFSQTAEGELAQIRDWFHEVNANVSQYRRVEYRDVSVYEDTSAARYSMEGKQIYRLAEVDMTKFFENEQLVKIILTFSGDREDMTSEYYFRDSNLFFVDKVKTIYHKPKWDEAFKASEKSIAKNRFYIKDNQLIRWIDPKVNSVASMDPSYHKQEAMILNDYKLYAGIE